MPNRSPVNIAHHDEASFGDRFADKVVARFGSWSFIIIQTIAVVLWIAANVVLLQILGTRPFDPYPFILLNLAFSTQASYAAPLILLAQNRQNERDRLKAEHDFAVNEEALRLIRRIDRKVHARGKNAPRTST